MFHTIVDDTYKLNIIDNFLSPDEADYLEERMEASGKSIQQDECEQGEMG